MRQLLDCLHDYPVVKLMFRKLDATLPFSATACRGVGRRGDGVSKHPFS